MVAFIHPFASPAGFLDAVRQHPKRVFAPAGIFAALVCLYAAVRPDTWEATQPVVLRNEAAGNQEALGKFRYPEEMKSKQETILELGKSNGVLAGTLTKVGPPANHRRKGTWPTPQDVVDFRRCVKLAPPKGVELGTAEVFYIKVKSDDRQRAEALAAALADSLQSAMQHLRNDRAQSMIDELNKAVALNEGDLEAATANLAAMEKDVGEDLSELRNLQEFPSGDSDIRRRTVEIENELRGAQEDERNDRELLKLLDDAKDSPNTILATPNRLLESQPALRRLKEGLIDAQLKSADLVGRLSEQHPLAEAARNSEVEIRRNLHDEIASARSGVEVNLRLTSARVGALKERLTAEQARLQRLALVRARYANLSGAVKQRTLMLETAQRDLTAARSAKAAAQSASVLMPIDTPDAGVKPIGPSRATLMFGGIIAGLLLGVAVLFLTEPPVPVEGTSHDAIALGRPQDSVARRILGAGQQYLKSIRSLGHSAMPGVDADQEAPPAGEAQDATRLITFTETGIDPLTGVRNRKRLEEMLDASFALMTRYNQEFSLFIVDIDDFHDVNRTQGRVHGDQILQAVARVIVGDTRETDLVARYNDEQFIVVMPHTDLEGASICAEKIRGAVEKAIHVTISGGVATARQGDDAKTLLDRAEMALRRAAEAGRNRVFRHPGKSGKRKIEPVPALVEGTVNEPSTASRS